MQIPDYKSRLEGTPRRFRQSLRQSDITVPGGFIWITTNGVDDRQKAMTHRGGQRRPRVDYTVKIRWNGYGLVQAMRRIMRRFF